MPRKKDPNRYPKGWNRRKVKAVMDHYEKQTEDEEVAEDEAGFREAGAIFAVPKKLIPAVRAMIVKHARKGA